MLAGLPEPRCNVVLGTDDHPIGRVDLLIEGYFVIIEYDADQHRTDKAQWATDITRNEEFGAEGYRTVRVTAEHMRRPRSVVGAFSGRCKPMATPVQSRPSGSNGARCSSGMCADPGFSVTKPGSVNP
jgi:hypothetical protein